MNREDIEIDRAIQEIIDWQRKRLLKEGRRRIPHLTLEDILQPNDYKELEQDPEFRYEEGLLAGMLSLQMLIQSQRFQNHSKKHSGDGLSTQNP